MFNLAALGMNPGNGHAYSWSAIFNGYDREEMAKCPYAGIPKYLFAQDRETMQIPDARVTHIWVQDREQAESVSRASLVPNIVDRPEDVIGQVDGAFICMDVGSEHLALARPFIEAGVPLFIDKPLCNSREDLHEFRKYYEKGLPVLSSSAMRFAKEIIGLDGEALGPISFVSGIMCKYWENYGIHALEGLYRIMGPGIESVQNLGTETENVVHICWKDGRHGVLNNIKHSTIFGQYQIIGRKSSVVIETTDFFYMFKKQLESFVHLLKTGEYPYPYEETLETVGAVIAGTMSREEDGRKVMLNEIV